MKRNLLWLFQLRQASHIVNEENYLRFVSHYLLKLQNQIRGGGIFNFCISKKKSDYVDKQQLLIGQSWKLKEEFGVRHPKIESRFFLGFARVMMSYMIAFIVLLIKLWYSSDIIYLLTTSTEVAKCNTSFQNQESWSKYSIGLE